MDSSSNSHESLGVFVIDDMLHSIAWEKMLIRVAVGCLLDGKSLLGDPQELRGIFFSHDSWKPKWRGVRAFFYIPSSTFFKHWFWSFNRFIEELIEVYDVRKMPPEPLRTMAFLQAHQIEILKWGGYTLERHSPSPKSAQKKDKEERIRLSLCHNITKSNYLSSIDTSQRWSSEK